MPMNLHKFIFVFFSVLVITACSFSTTTINKDTQRKIKARQSLAELQPAVLPDQGSELPTIALNELTALYRDVASLTLSDEIRVKVLERLAGLELLLSEDKLYEGNEDNNGASFALAIQAYENILEDYPDADNLDQIKYQLSKAYDLSGQNDKAIATIDDIANKHPDSENIEEVYFRIAESYFANAEYRKAAIYYTKVLQEGLNAYSKNALYMRGWSLFKLDLYDDSIESFGLLLDSLVPENNEVDLIERGERELVFDSFRVIAVMLSYLDGAKSIDETLLAKGDRHYLPLVYKELGALYVKQERYLDGAQTYSAFVDKYPSHRDAHTLFNLKIDAFLKGAFTEDLLAAKEEYVERFSVFSDYWQLHDSSRDSMAETLKVYLEELATFYHAQAQENQRLKNKKKKSSLPAFRKAANYYADYIKSFPKDKKVPDMLFLMSESYYESEQFDKAINAYELLAYTYGHHKQAAAAGYAAILAYEKLRPQLPIEEIVGLDKRKIASAVMFSEAFPNDPNAIPVLANGAETLLANGNYEKAVAISERILLWQLPVAPIFTKTALLVNGHSYFELKKYSQAEKAYIKVKSFISPNTKEYTELVDRLAATIYKQGEQESANENLLAAAEQFMRIVEMAPNSSVRMSAQFDAANSYLQAESWKLAIPILLDFRKRFPENSLNESVPNKLILAYENTDQWLKAAAELEAVFNNAKESETKRETLFLAANYYEKGDDVEASRLAYRRYANNFPEPFVIVMEARYKLSEIYKSRNEYSNRLFWLKKMIRGHDTAGSDQTDRTRYLAAFSSVVFADEDMKSFAKIKLTQPLKRSLKKKKKALEKVIASLQKTNGYGVEKFSTLASHRMAAVYSGLSEDLLASTRPKNLDELALEQYEVLIEEQAYPF